MHKFFIDDLKVINGYFIGACGVLGTMRTILLLNLDLREFHPMNEWLVENEVASHYEVSKAGEFYVWHLVIHEDIPATHFRLMWQQFPLGVPAAIRAIHEASI